jgi:hypothetical protein
MRFLAPIVLGSTLACASTLPAQQVDEKDQARTKQATALTSSFHEELIGEASVGGQLQGIAAGEHRVAWVEKQGTSQIVKLDGKQQGGAYEDVKYLSTADDDLHFAFFGKRASKWVLIVDGQERPQEFTTVSGIAFRTKGTSVAYSGCVEKKCQLILDGASVGAEYEDISHPQFSDDGKRLAYCGKRGKRWIAVVDGKEMGPEVDAPQLFGFDPSGSRFYVGGFNRGRSFLSYAVDGVIAGPDFEVISPIAFSSDGKHYVYAGAAAKTGFKKEAVFSTIVLDGQATAKYEGTGVSRVTGRSFLTGGAPQMSLVWGLRDFHPEVDGTSNPAFNAEGKLVYAARRGAGEIAVLAGSDSGPTLVAIPSPIAFTNDSKHFAYVGNRDVGWIEVRDNTPVRSPSAFSAGNTGIIGIPWVGLSDDAAHLAYVVDFREKEQSRSSLSVVIDGHESKRYDNLTGIRFVEDRRSLTFIALDGMRLLRVTYALQ